MSGSKTFRQVDRLKEILKRLDPDGSKSESPFVRGLREQLDGMLLAKSMRERRLEGVDHFMIGSMGAPVSALKRPLPDLQNLPFDPTIEAVEGTARRARESRESTTGGPKD